MPGRVTTVHFRQLSRANELTALPLVRNKFTRIGLMIHHLRFESSAELIRLTETLTRFATDSGE